MYKMSIRNMRVYCIVLKKMKQQKNYLHSTVYHLQHLLVVFVRTKSFLNDIFNIKYSLAAYVYTLKELFMVLSDL